jgi:hypothetical protein
MNRHAGHPRLYVAPLRGLYIAPLWVVMRRIARTLGIVVSPIAGELRRLNRIGAGAGSRGERVRLVKQTLARRGNGPNRCC